MIHIGTKEYYEQISNLCNDFNLILTKGIQLNKKTDIGKYKKMAKLFSLKNQSDYLRFKNDLPLINIDMEKDIFKKDYGNLSFKDKLFSLKYNVILFVLSLNINKSKKLLYDFFSYNNENYMKLINPYNHYSYKHNKSLFKYLIENKRNKYKVKNQQGS
jgi:hypothetical protein